LNSPIKIEGSDGAVGSPHTQAESRSLMSPSGGNATGLRVLRSTPLERFAAMPMVLD